jgi:hypothetical protein
MQVGIYSITGVKIMEEEENKDLTSKKNAQQDKIHDCDVICNFPPRTTLNFHFLFK